MQSRDFDLCVTDGQDSVVINVNFCFVINSLLLENGRVFNKFKQQNMWIKMIFIELIYSSENWRLSECLAGFLVHVQKFSRVLNKLKVMVSSEAVCDIFDLFFSFIF